MFTGQVLPYSNDPSTALKTVFYSVFYSVFRIWHIWIVSSVLLLWTGSPVLAQFAAGDERLEQDVANLLSQRAGATIIAASHQGEASHSVQQLIDPTAGPEGLWRVPVGKGYPHWVVIALPEPTLLTTFAVNTKHLNEQQEGMKGCTVNYLVISVSNEKDHRSFKQVADYHLRKYRDDQIISIEATEARYIRLEIHSNWKNPDYVELGRVYAYNDLTFNHFQNELYITGSVEVPEIRFETGSADLLPASRPLLETIGAILAQNPKWTLTIEGHTDSQGTPEANQSLSERRAKSVAQVLTQMGIAKGRLTAKGFGQSKPIAANDSADGKAQNRRVTFRIQKHE